jgi:hypothetical protein
MATNRSGHRPGGGIASSVNVSPRVRTGTGSRGTHPGGVAQLGQRVGDKATHGNSKGTGYRGEPLHNNRSFHPVKFGNEVALNVGKGGCGTGRTLYGQAGSQGTHGAVNPGQPRPNTQRDALENE